MCNVQSAPNSRETIKQVYAVYKVLTANIEIEIKAITIDKASSRAVVELEESVSAALVPFDLVRFRRIKIITVLDLERDMGTGGDGRYRIAKQYGGFCILTDKG